MFVRTDFSFNRLISLVRIQLYFCAFFLSLFIVTSDMYFYPMNSDLIFSVSDLNARRGSQQPILLFHKSKGG